MKIGSIDIGTNAIKSKIFETSPSSISFIGGIRSPIRLGEEVFKNGYLTDCLLYTSPSPRDVEESRMPASA